MPTTNRAILLTAPGVGAIAVVRLTGPDVAPFLARHFSRPLSASRCVHGNLHDEFGEPIDDPVIVLAPDQSFADINLHGGPWVVRATLELARRRGFEVISAPTAPLPDESVDAESTIEREVLAYLPLATTELALSALLSQEQAWRSLLGRAASIAPEEIQRILDDRALHHLLHPPRVAIVGAPNVGKSTLANSLFAQERSITADLPGTTRDWVGELANLDGLVVQLVDTPGLRETDDPIEGAPIERSRAEVERADLVVHVLDATQPQHVSDAAEEGLVVLNKCDVGSAEIDGAIRTVATTGEGVRELMRAIRAHFGCDGIDESRPRCWTDRQRDLLRSLIA